MVKPQGAVYLVGAGPGTHDLITVKGADHIKTADVIVHDALIDGNLLNLAREDAEIIDAGKRGGSHRMSQNEINAILVDKAREGKKVVRLKGGDPFLFGRGAEEVEVLRREGIEVHVVPGISSAIAVPELAGIPVTHRNFASTVTIVTGHEGREKEGSPVDWSKLASLGGTIVILMGMSRLSNNMESLIRSGMDPETPAAVIQNGASPGMKVVVSTISGIADECRRAGIGAPAVVVVGDVVSLRETLGDLL